MPKEVAYEDLMAVKNKVIAYGWISGTGNGEGERLVIPNLLRESEPYPVDDWKTILFSYGIDDDPLETAALLDRRGVLLE